MEKSLTLAKYVELYDKTKFLEQTEEMSFAEYVDRVKENPRLARNAFQYMYDMIISKGTETFERYRTTYTRYNFFSDKEIPIFGLEEQLDQIVNFIHGAAGGYGSEKRVLLLHGPVGSSKSTICRLLKRGLERYSRTPAGAWYTYKWVGLGSLYTSEENECPMHEDPLRLMPDEMRDAFFADLNKTLVDITPETERAGLYKLKTEGEICPRCRVFMNELLKKYKGDWEAVVNNHIRVIRKVHSEIDRVGIGTFQPKDEKNQDSTELSGDINFRSVGHYGSTSDARAFDFDGEFNVGNRGCVEFIEWLKLATEFLYDCLGASQEHNIKPKKFPQMNIDEVIIAHTNQAEYEKLQANQFMEALRDRTVKIDIPYNVRWSDEVKVLEHSYGDGKKNKKVRQHVMPHTVEMGAFFAVLTRLQTDKDGKLTLRDKVKLYDGRSLPNQTEDSVKEHRDKYPTEGMKGGLSIRFVQDAFSNCLAQAHIRESEDGNGYVNVFHLFNELKAKLHNSPSLSVESKSHYQECLDEAELELQDILKSEVNKAIMADENLIIRVCSKYIDNVVAYVNNEPIIDPITKKERKADERLMRAIEEKIDIPEQGSDQFRMSIAKFMGTLQHKGKEFRWDSNAELKSALERYVFDLCKDTIRLSTLSSEVEVVDKDEQEKIEAIKTRLIRNYGYNSQSAKDVLDYVAGLYAGTSN